MSAETTVTIEKLVYGGDGLARLDGQVILTPYVLPGETVRVTVDRAKNDLLRGRLLEVVEPGPHRTQPPCPYFYRCGGCQYQHASYELQLGQKLAILREVLRRTGKLEFEGEIQVVAGEPWHYRNRVQLHLDRGRVGYFEAGSHRLCAIDHCPISSPKLNQAIAELSREAHAYRGVTAGIELFTNEADVQVNISDAVPDSVRTLLGAIGSGDPLEYAGFRVSRNSFFQVNRFLVEKLLDAAVNGLQGETALDLYAGVGLFSLRLARSFKTVTAVESGWRAFRDLEFNMQRAALPIMVTHGTTEQFVATLDQTPDLIVADPPRTGLGKAVTSELVRLRAPLVVIVSCDPATLARDLQSLTSAGYTIDRLSLVDLFPQTFHLETVVRLKLK